MNEWDTANLWLAPVLRSLTVPPVVAGDGMLVEGRAGTNLVAAKPLVTIVITKTVGCVRLF